MLNEAEHEKVKMIKQFDENGKQVKEILAENTQLKKSVSHGKEKAAKDEGTKSELRKEIIELKQSITSLRSEKEHLKSDMNTEMRRYDSEAIKAIRTLCLLFSKGYFS